MLNQVIATLEDNEFTVAELNLVAQAAQNLASGAEARFAKVFGLGDRVKLNTGQVETVVRRNKWTVTVADKNGATRKITPSDIEALVEAGDPDNFEYFDYFGTRAE